MPNQKHLYQSNSNFTDPAAPQRAIAKLIAQAIKQSSNKELPKLIVGSNSPDVDIGLAAPTTGYSAI
jgi:hypothetical protein